MSDDSENASQDQLINFLRGIGWTFIERYQLPQWRNNDETQPFLVDVLRRQLVKLNAGRQSMGVSTTI
jgi:hypothetical protein